MFERYNEKARRVIFFARYEASQYGSPYIEPEHLLLGLMREDRALMKQFLSETDAESEIRTEIERRFPARERISTSVEMPLSTEGKKTLYLAGEESDRLSHRHIGTEHILLGLLQMEGSLTSQILHARGLKAQEVRERLAKTVPAGNVRVQESSTALAKLGEFLAGLKWHGSEELLPFFAEKAQFVNVYGKRWSREEIQKEFETLFAPYAKKNAVYTLEKTIQDAKDVLIAIVLWKNAVLASMERIWIHRMSVALVREDEGWRILLMHVSPVQQFGVAPPG